MLQLNRVRSISHPDPLWHGKVVCRQYVQGYCSYGTRCKYDHPSATGGEQWFDPQPLPLCSQAAPNSWLPSHDSGDRRYSDGGNSDGTRHYTTTRWLGNGTFLHGNKVTHNQLSANNGPMDPKKMRSIIAWKTTPCKHFIKNNGWCPLGDACNFIHDWQLVHSNMWNRDIIRQTAESSSRPDGNHKATSHCWAHVQGFCGARNCPHFHPADIQPYIKYTPCPAWILCDKRSTCAFKHFDAIPSGPHEPEPIPAQAPPQQLPPPPPPPQVFYPSPAPIPVPSAYSPPNVPAPKPVEVNGTTYFPLVHETPLPDEYNYPQAAAIAPLPMAAPIPLAPLPSTHSILSGSINDPPLSSSPPSYQHGLQAYQFAEPTIPEQASVMEPRPLSAPSTQAITARDTKDDQTEPCTAGKETETELATIPDGSPGVEPQINENISAEPAAGDHQRKRRSHGHVRRISINVKTGEVVERTLEGRHGVYGL